MPINSVTLEPGVTGKNLCKVLFTPDSPEPARQFSVEAVFEVKRVDTVRLDGQDPYAVFLISCTRTDTREPYPLTEQQRDVLVEAALEEAANAWDGE